ncbi:MAG: transcription elongation factor GreA, partial [Myxococcales bacterium]|nr:transcription elongation factor GreA [Myxococcales bacterium]
MSTAQRVPMTPTGNAKLKAALKDFKEVQRPANVLAIEEARAHGDLRENAEYHAAKEKQAMIAAMISDIEDKLS